jgi:hypothetical protein
MLSVPLYMDFGFNTLLFPNSYQGARILPMKNPTETFSRTCTSTTMSSESEHYCITSMNLDDKEYDAVAPEILDSFRLTRCKGFSTTCPSTTTSCPMEVMDAELPFETSLFEIEKAVYKHESRRGISCPCLQ